MAATLFYSVTLGYIQILTKTKTLALESDISHNVRLCQLSREQNIIEHIEEEKSASLCSCFHYSSMSKGCHQILPVAVDSCLQTGEHLILEMVAAPALLLL
jgi:hypothetical protein